MEMTLASRAYGPESCGTVLGVIAATIGLGAAAGPLLGGALSESLGWESLFFINVAAAVTIPLGLKILPKDEERSGGGIDLFGGVALGLLVGGVLLIPFRGSTVRLGVVARPGGSSHRDHRIGWPLGPSMDRWFTFYPTRVFAQLTLRFAGVDELFRNGHQPGGSHWVAYTAYL